MPTAKDIAGRASAGSLRAYPLGAWKLESYVEVADDG